MKGLWMAVSAGLALAVLMPSGGGHAEEEMVMLDGLALSAAWARPTIGYAPNSAAYLTIENKGAAAARLIAAASDKAARVELHTHVMEDGVARMRPIEAIEIAPGTTHVLRPHGDHLMVFGLTDPLKKGETIALTLTFEDRGAVTLDVPVADGPSMDEMKEHGAE